MQGGAFKYLNQLMHWLSGWWFIVKLRSSSRSGKGQVKVRVRSESCELKDLTNLKTLTFESVQVWQLEINLMKGEEKIYRCLVCPNIDQCLSLSESITE